nr:MAG TPA: hypothetical protein [Caudoviricetes sp.]
MCFNIVNGIGLVIMRYEVHQSFLQSAQRYQSHRHESPESEEVCAVPFAVGVGILRVPLILRRQTSHQVIRLGGLASLRKKETRTSVQYHQPFLLQLSISFLSFFLTYLSSIRPLN